MTDRYEYKNISKESIDVAVKELNENPEQVNAHIESFRRWIKSMHHLKCPTDSDFLIKFLRVAKYDHKKAQQRLDNFCTVRSSPRGAPNFFKGLKISNPVVKQILDLQYMIPLGICDEGQLVVLARSSVWDPDKISPDIMFNYMFMGFDQMIHDEMLQIHGIITIIDLAGASRRSFEVWSDPKLARKFTQINQDSYPLRNKLQVFYNEPIIFDIAFQVFQFFMSEKMKTRVLRVKNDINKAIEKIPGLDRLLPKEYGGPAGTCKELSSKWSDKFLRYFKDGNPYDCIKVDESKRPKETIEYLKEHAEYTGVTLGTSGTYTKFENIY